MAVALVAAAWRKGSQRPSKAFVRGTPQEPTVRPRGCVSSHLGLLCARPSGAKLAWSSPWASPCAPRSPSPPSDPFGSTRRLCFGQLVFYNLCRLYCVAGPSARGGIGQLMSCLLLKHLELICSRFIFLSTEPQSKLRRILATSVPHSGPHTSTPPCWLRVNTSLPVLCRSTTCRASASSAPRLSFHQPAKCLREPFSRISTEAPESRHKTVGRGSVC